MGVGQKMGRPTWGLMKGQMPPTIRCTTCKGYVNIILGPPVVPLYNCFGGGFPYYNRLHTKNGTLILTSPLEDLATNSPLWFL